MYCYLLTYTLCDNTDVELSVIKENYLDYPFERVDTTFVNKNNYVHDSRKRMVEKQDIIESLLTAWLEERFTD